MFAEAFAEVALAISAEFAGPFHDGKLHWPGTPVYDDGGSIVTPGTPVEYDCSVQVDVVTEGMRLEAGYVDKDVRLIILAPDLERAVDTDATVEVTEGPHAGWWSVQSEAMDVLGFAYDGRGRRMQAPA